MTSGTVLSAREREADAGAGERGLGRLVGPVASARGRVSGPVGLGRIGEKRRSSPSSFFVFVFFSNMNSVVICLFV
jgi:hypothetical protein